MTIIPFYHPSVKFKGQDVTWIHFLSSHDLFYYPFYDEVDKEAARDLLRERMKNIPDLGKWVHRRHRYVVTRRMLYHLSENERELRARGRFRSKTSECPINALTNYNHWRNLPPFRLNNPLWDPAIFGDMLEGVAADPKTFNVNDE
ncbi:hypothetical protein HDU96_002112 [Phlyctochytrium bullatum]|nr:hypothetical protein HDU96_002112 [Phlyctochytrium bullatum]